MIMEFFLSGENYTHLCWDTNNNLHGNFTFITEKRDDRVLNEQSARPCCIKTIFRLHNLSNKLKYNIKIYFKQY